MGSAGAGRSVHQTLVVRIGTWNLQGRWDERHLAHIVAMRCDVLLLTELPERVDVPGMGLHTTSAPMAPRRRWAGVASRQPQRALADPHGATAMVEIDGLRVCSSVLPWRSCGSRDPWRGSTTAEKTAHAVGDIGAAAPTVWGGDWNHAMSGREWSGSQHGRLSIQEALDGLGLQVPTASAPHQIDGLLSIDHIAVPAAWKVLVDEHHPATFCGARISDHDAYVIEVDRTAANGSSP